MKIKQTLHPLWADHALHWIDDELETLSALGLRRQLRHRQSAQGVQIETAGGPLINFGSNDYLNLANHPRIAQSVSEALTQEGWGGGASPLIIGRAQGHVTLERQLAEFEGTQAAMLFPSGFAANVGAIPALAGPGDIIFSDAANHASIIDGCRLARARVQVYPHNDVDYLRKMLEQTRQFRRRLIVTESVFSMEGSHARLSHLASLAEEFAAMLLVDEAHATGIFGKHGRGLCEMQGVEDGVHVRVGTCSKALGCAGGFIVGSRSLIDWLTHRARSYVFSTAPPAAWCAAISAAVALVQDEPHRRKELLEKANLLREELSSQGWHCGEAAGQIVPVYMGEPHPTMELAQTLLDGGLFVPGIRPPSVPKGQSLLRISVSCGHSEQMLHRLASAMKDLRARR